MSSYIEEEFSTKENQQLRHFISYLISSWVTFERDNFLKNEKNWGIKELNDKFSQWNHYLPEKIDKMARLGYSIYSELKTLEESYDQLESRIKSSRKDEIINNKNLKDQAIIDEYEEYKKSLKNVRFVFVTADDQAYGMAQGRFDSIKVKVKRKIPKTLECNTEKAAKLIYQLTLFLGFLRINNYNIRFNIYFRGKEHDDWENKRLEFTCSDNKFEKRIKKLIGIKRQLDALCNG
ncbi:MAG: hypothetical protein GF308_16885 [Candidatus Heimdallarchaeota archaeon]|nr:hypothetical protein [Candidatus Heimdallarchaeota archaeon]